MTLWVTSSTVVPCSARRRSTADHTARRATGSIAVVGSSSTSSGRSPTSAAAKHASRRWPAGQLLQRPPGERREPQLVEYGVPLGPCLPGLQAAQPSGGLGGERDGQFVEGGGLLPEVGEDPRGPLRVAHDVVPEDLDAAAVGPHQPGQLAYEGGLAGAVGPEQPEDLAAPDVQPYVVGGPHLGCPRARRAGPRTAG